ncbi:hypothetical protein XENORESO_020262 [Xenotaenia resolanae]|uniref:Uncharacterized protein n=1 Tax=Xenotaenia resolanae TaxID=208358 RepID=A0ABV0WYI3_9TELE
MFNQNQTEPLQQDARLYYAPASHCAADITFTCPIRHSNRQSPSDIQIEKAKQITSAHQLDQNLLQPCAVHDEFSLIRITELSLLPYYTLPGRQLRRQQFKETEQWFITLQVETSNLKHYKQDKL